MGGERIDQVTPWDLPLSASIATVASLAITSGCPIRADTWRNRVLHGRVPRLVALYHASAHVSKLAAQWTMATRTYKIVNQRRNLILDWHTKLIAEPSICGEGRGTWN
jgi:hypothetical protein